MLCCRFIWECGGALPLLEKLLHVLMNKLVEQEAFLYQPLSTRLLKPNFCFTLPEHSTTVSLETRNPIFFFLVGFDSEF